MAKHDTTRLLDALIKQEKQASDSLHAYSREASAAASSLNAWAVADSTVPDFKEAAMRVADLLMQSADRQQGYISALTAYRESLKDVMAQELEVKVIARDREILVSKVVKLSSKKPGDKRAEAHSFKLDEVQNELGACEATLRSEETALAALKQRIFKEALTMRLRAQAELGHTYLDLSEEGIEVLERLSENPELERFSAPLSPGLPPVVNGDIPSADSIAPSHSASNQEEQSPPPMRATGRPATVPEEPNSSDEEATIRRQFVEHKNPARAGPDRPRNASSASPVKRHKRDTSSDLDSMSGGKKSGFFGSIASLFKPRDLLLAKDDDSMKGFSISPKKKKGWNTRIDANAAVQREINLRAAEATSSTVIEKKTPRRARRNSSSSEERDNRRLTKVVNNTPPLWQDLGISSAAPPARKKSTKVRSGSVTEAPASLMVHKPPRRAASESGFSDPGAYEPPSRPAGITRTNSTSKASTTKKKRASVVSHEQLWPQSAAGLGQLNYTPSMASIMSDSAEPPVPTSRKYLTPSDRTLSAGPAQLALRPDAPKRRKSNASTVKKSKSTSRPQSVLSNASTATGQIAVLTVPSAAAYKNASYNDGLTTLALPSAAGSRAVMSGNTLTLPTAPPPVSSSQSHKRLSASAPPTSTPYRQPSPIAMPAAMSPKSNGILHSPSATPRTLSPTPGIIRAASPTPTTGTARRKSVRIVDSPDLGSTELPVMHQPPIYQTPDKSGKGKERATPAQIESWGRPYRDDSSDDEDADVAEYRAARKSLARQWDEPNL